MSMPLLFVPELAELWPTQSMVGKILRNARMNNDSRKVACHLVGAIFTLRIADSRKTPKAWSARKCRYGADFWIGTTAFFVSVSLTNSLFKRINAAIETDAQVYLLTTEFHYKTARNKTAKNHLSDRVMVQTVESFVGTMIDLRSQFIPARVREYCERLIEAYNARVSRVEREKRLLIETAKCYE